MTPTKQDRWNALVRYLIGYQATWVTDIGLKTGLFSAIADAGRGVSAAELAAGVSFDERYVELWCRSAYAFALLDWDEHDGFSIDAEMGALLLDASDSMFIGGRMQFIAALHEDFRIFPDRLREGGIWPRSEHDPWLLEALKKSSQPDSGVWTEVVLPQAAHTLDRLEQGGRILDVGSGAGSALIHYALRFPESHVVGLEPDEESIELARLAVAESGLADRIELRHADANRLDAIDEFDLVTLNIALHETGGPTEHRNVLRRVHQALRPGGTVLVAELPYPDSTEAYREQPVYQLLAGLQLHEALVGCGAITQGELPELLTGAGFAAVRVADQPMPTRFVMLAEKT